MNETERPGRFALRFFAMMIILTLVARGASGSAMARVSLASVSRGTIIQQTSADAIIAAGEGETIELPAGVSVSAVYAAEGQSLNEGDPILLLDVEDLKEQLELCRVTRAQQQARLDGLRVSTAPDGSGISSAQQSLERAREDYSRTDADTGASVEEAAAALSQAQQTRDEAYRRLDEIAGRTDPLPTEEELAAARQAADDADTALTAAQQTLKEAQSARDDALLSAARNIENAESALAQANTAYSQARQSADLTAQSNAAQAAGVELEQKETDRQIELLTKLIEADGLVCAPRDTQLIQCTLEQGKPCPEDGGVRLAREDAELLAQFSLAEDEAEKLSGGQTVTVRQGAASAEAAVRSIGTVGTDGTCAVTAVLPDDAAGFRSGAAEAEIVFSRTVYDSCLPTAAIRQDTQGSYVLTIEESGSTFGIAYTAVRVPVTVLEVDSSGQYAAVEASVGGDVIVSSTRPVSPGSSVRIEE